MRATAIGGDSIRRMLLACLVVLSVPQDPAHAAPPATIRVAMTAKVPGEAGSLRWSPKGATVPLAAPADAKDQQVLAGEFALGPDGVPPVRVELRKSPGAERFDRLAIDCDRDGAFGDDELLTTTPKEQRGKWWSSFEATAAVPVAAQQGAERQPYPLALWFVFDPTEPDTKPALRWSRRGWHEGAFEFDGKPVHVLLTEAQMDGVFTAGDMWQLGADRDAMLRGDARSLATHAWVRGRAFRVAEFAPDGRSITVAPFDPGITEAEERDRADLMKADRTAKRAERPLAFGHDLAAALAEAATSHKRVFVDFETTWCGPCKQMDALVYVAADVVAAAADVIAVKVDGDEHKELVKRYGVAAYPTMLLLDEAGAVQRRAVGYQGVAAMVAFFGKREPGTR